MISIIVPYRDRPKHLVKFLNAMRNITNVKEVIIVEQEQGKQFNRGKLLNIGAILSIGDTLVFHDVDMIPEFSKYPSSDNLVTQLAKSNIQTVDYLGGVTMFKSDIFFQIGGYSNNFFSRAEDNEMMFRLKRFNIDVINDFHKFRMLDHDRPKTEFDPKLWAKAQLPRYIDGIEHCKFFKLDETKEGEVKMITASI